MEEKVFPYEEYIQKRLKEIQDLEERKEAKEILWEGLGKLFALTEQKYEDLEKRIYRELPIQADRYTVVTALEGKDTYDPINGIFSPVCKEDMKQGEDGAFSAFRFYLEAGDAVCRKFLETGHVTGRDQKSGEEVRFRIERDERYLGKVSELYELFSHNLIPWNTVHTGFLERFYFLVPQEGDAVEIAEDMEIDWGEFAPFVRTDLLPLWNISHVDFRTSDYMLPGEDGIYYEHYIVVEEEDMNHGYLVDFHDDIVNIRYEGNRIVIKIKQAEMREYHGLQLKKVPDAVKKEYSKGTLSNEKKDSFAARYQQQTGNFIQTKMELFRRIEELTKDSSLEVDTFIITEEADGDIWEADMNAFIAEPAFPEDKRAYLLFSFKEDTGKDYLYASHIRFLLSQLQQEYIEYRCVGTTACKDIEGPSEMDDELIYMTRC